MYKTLVFCFFVVLSWTDLFLLFGKIPLFMLFGAILILVFTIKTKPIIKSVYGKEDILIILLVFLVILSGILGGNEKTVNYILTYVFVFFGLYLLLKGIISSNLTLEFIMRSVVFGVFLTIFFVLIEFSLNFILHINIQEYLLRHREASATFMDGAMHRSYGFSTEPGVASYYFSTIGMVSLWYIMYIANLKKITKLFLAISFLLGYLTLYSSAGVAAITISFTLSFLLFKFNLRIILKTTFLTTLMLLALFSLNPNWMDFLTPMYEKIMNLSGTYSGTFRLERWHDAIEIIINHPVFGVGVGYLSVNGEGSPISWYLFLMSESGILSGVSVFIFYIIVLYKIINSSIKGKQLLFVSVLSGIIHLSLISTFQYPYLFITIILISIIINNGISSTGSYRWYYPRVSK